jgi:penicillin-binding protein 1C
VGRADNGAVPGLVGRIAAAPILFEAFARIGMEAGVQARPDDAIVAATHELPPPLRHMRKDLPKTTTALTSASLRVAFPPDGSQLELAPPQAGEAASFLLKITGGAPPFTAYLNGRPIAFATSRRSLELRPEGLGFARISIVDGRGDTDSVSVRMQ